MRADRCQYDSRQQWVQDRSARREGIGRRAGRGGDNDAVTAGTTNRLPIYPGVELDRLPRGTLGQHDIIECSTLIKHLTRTQQLGKEHHPLLDFKFPGQQLVEVIVHVFSGYIRQEA